MQFKQGLLLEKLLKAQFEFHISKNIEKEGKIPLQWELLKNYSITERKKIHSFLFVWLKIDNTQRFQLNTHLPH